MWNWARLFALEGGQIGRARIAGYPAGGGRRHRPCRPLMWWDVRPMATPTVGTVALHAWPAIAIARERDHLRAAVESREVIGQAKGILMRRTQVTAEQAFDQLVRASRRTNVKVRHVAESICYTGTFARPETDTAG